MIINFKYFKKQPLATNNDLEIWRLELEAEGTKDEIVEYATSLYMAYEEYLQVSNSFFVENIKKK